MLALSIVAGPLLAELALRALLFSDIGWVQRLAAHWELRRPELFADRSFDDDFWKLQRLFLPTEAQRLEAVPCFDPLLGWRVPEIGADHDHVSHAGVGQRRPLLLYGASFCDEHFNAPFEASELSRDYGLVNYSVGGFGLDQVYLLLRESLDHYAGERPIVVLSVYVDGDFDRATLGFRSWPKPHATVTPEGRLAFDTAPLPSVAEYLGRHPPAITSYVARSLHEHALPDSVRDRREAERRRIKRELFEALVRSIDDELVRRGIPYFYVLFCDQYYLRAGGPVGWQEEFLTGVFEREGIAYECVRPVMSRSLKVSGERVEDYFVQPPDERMNHPTPRGLTVALHCFRRGLAGVRERETAAAEGRPGPAR